MSYIRPACRQAGDRRIYDINLQYLVIKLKKSASLLTRLKLIPG